MKVVESVFNKTLANLGELALVPLDLTHHAKDIHHWVNQPYAKYWQMQNTSLEMVINAYEKLLAIEGYKVFIGYFNQNPISILEIYDPKNSDLKDLYNQQDTDKGMHLLIAPPKQTIPNFTLMICMFSLSFIFNDLYINRVVIEPDVDNEKMHQKNKKHEVFIYEKTISLSNKEAYLAFCTRVNYEMIKNKYKLDF